MDITIECEMIGGKMSESGAIAVSDSPVSAIVVFESVRDV